MPFCGPMDRCSDRHSCVLSTSPKTGQGKEKKRFHKIVAKKKNKVLRTHQQNRCRWVPLNLKLLKSKLAFIRCILKTTSQSLLCYSACLIWNSLNSKDFYLAVFVWIKRDPSVQNQEQDNRSRLPLSSLALQWNPHLRHQAEEVGVWSGWKWD